MAVTTTERGRLRTLGMVTALVALISATLLGCSSDDNGSGGTSPTSRPAASSSRAPGGSPAGSGAPATPLVAAARLAQAQVPDTTVVTVEQDRNGTVWKVQVVSPDGTEHEVVVSADGTQVVSGPTRTPDDEEDRAEHRREVAADRIGFERAAAVVLDVVPKGTITGLDLDTYQGFTVWDAEVRTADGTEHDVKVGAGTGEVLVNRAD